MYCTACGGFYLCFLWLAFRCFVFIAEIVCGCAVAPQYVPGYSVLLVSAPLFHKDQPGGQGTSAVALVVGRPMYVYSEKRSLSSPIFNLFCLFFQHPSLAAKRLTKHLAYVCIRECARAPALFCFEFERVLFFVPCFDPPRTHRSLGAQRLEAVTRSPVYSQLSETLDGLVTIRAFGSHSKCTVL